MKPTFRYPYTLEGGCEELSASDKVLRVLRGGAYFYTLRLARCADRGRLRPNLAYGGRYGMRVVVLPKKL